MYIVEYPLQLNESIYFDFTPPPTYAGHINRFPFKINITSSYEGDHIVTLDSKYSRSYTPQANTYKWSFLRPECRFYDLSGKQIYSVKTKDTSLFLDSNNNLNTLSGTFAGVSGTAEFYFVDDLYNFDLAISNQPYTTILATLQTSGLNVIDGNREYVTLGYSNSQAIALQPHIFYYREPDYIKVSENGIRDFINPRWSAIQQPVIFNINWKQYKDTFNDGNEIIPINEQSNFCHYFPYNASTNIKIYAGTVNLSSYFTTPLEINQTDQNGYLASGYCKTLLNVPYQTTLNVIITASSTFMSPTLSGNDYSNKIWISNPNAGVIGLVEYNAPQNFSLESNQNLQTIQLYNFDVPIIQTPDFTKDNYFTLGFHNINSIAVLPPPIHQAWACDGDLNYLYKFSSNGTILCAIDVNQVATDNNLTFFVENQVSPASISLDGKQNIWMTLYDTSSILKFDSNGNFKFAVNPLVSLKPNINNDWYKANEPVNIAVETQNFVEPTYLDTDTSNNVWVTYSNYASGYLIKYNENGNVLKTINYPVSTCPQDVLVDCNNNVWVALSNDIYNSIGSLEKRDTNGNLLSSFGNIRGLNNLTIDINQNIWFTYSYSRIATIDNLSGSIATIDISNYDDTPLTTSRDNPKELIYTPSPQSDTITNSINNINEIILSLDNVPASKPHGAISNSSYQLASQQLLAAKAQIQQAVVDFATANYPSAMSNNATLTAYCYRDTGFIVDALVADIANNANHRSIEVGNFYYKGVTLNVTVPYGDLILPPEEIAATINSISFIATYVAYNNIVTDSARQADVAARVADIVYPIQNNGALNSYFPAGSATATDINIANIIIANRSLLQNQVSNYVAAKQYLSNANSSLIQVCNRDVGLIVDAIYNDLLTGVNARSIEYGLAYWNGSTSRLPDSLVSDHKNKTIDTFNYLNKCIKNILVANGNITSSTVSEYNVYPDKGLTVPDDNTSETALEGIASDARGFIYVINSVENQVYVFNCNTKKFINKFYVNPKGFTFFSPTDQSGTIIQYNPYQKSAQAYGDWTGFKWINKYNNNIDIAPHQISLFGQSTPLNFYINDSVDAFKVNENKDLGAQMKSLAFMPTLQDSTYMFDEFLPSIYGEYPFKHDDLGIKSYEKISNFTKNIADVDVCGINELYSLAASVNELTDDYQLSYPPDIQRLMDLISINQSRLWGSPAKNQNNFSKASEDGIFNRGTLLSNSYIVSAGTPIILRTKSLNKYDLIQTGNIKGLSSYPISTLIDFIGLDVITWNFYYEFYHFIPTISTTYYDNVIDWNNPQTTVNQNLSSFYQWLGDEQIVDQLFSYKLYNGLGLIS